jgi:hypothetical protein
MPLWLPDRSPQLTETVAVGGVSSDIPVTLTSGATANTRGSWVQLISSTAADAYGLWLWARGVAAANGDGRCLIDVAVGPSGSELIILPDLNFGAAPSSNTALNRNMFVPIYIPAGSRVAARCQRDTASGTVTIGWMLEEQPAWPGGVGVLGTTYGIDAGNSRGTIITTSTAAYGAWQQIVASTSAPHAWWWPGIDCGGDTTQSNAACFVQLGVGGAGSEVVLGTWQFRITTSEDMCGPNQPHPIYRQLPAGVRIAARASNASNSLGVAVHAVS